MAKVTEAVITILRDDAGVGAVIGDRIADSVVPRGFSRPYAWVEVSDVEPVRSVDSGYTGLATGNLTLAIVADTPSVREDAYDAIASAVDSVSPGDEVITPGGGTVRFHALEVLGATDDVIDLDEDSRDRIFARTITLFSGWEE